MKMVTNLFCAGLVVVFGGCATPSTPPLIFGQSHILGISVSTGTSGQAGDFTLGYKSFDLAIVPVIAANKDGTNTQVESSSNSGAVVDALSVLGQFNTSTATGASGNVSLGEFFSTGAAAQALSVGFATNLCNSGGNSSSNKSGDGGGATTPGKTTDSAGSNQAAISNGINCNGLFATTAKSSSSPNSSSTTSSTSKSDTTDSSSTKSNGSTSRAGQNTGVSQKQ